MQFTNLIRSLNLLFHFILQLFNKKIHVFLKNVCGDSDLRSFQLAFHFLESAGYIFFNDVRVEHWISKIYFIVKLQNQQFLFYDQNRRVVIQQYAKITSHKLILHSFYHSLQLSSQFYILLMLSHLTTQNKKDQKMKEDKCFSTNSNAQQIKLMAEVLSKMGKFFNDMAEQCLAHLAKPQANIHKEKMKLNKQNLKQIQNSKAVHKPDLQSKETYKSLKKDLVLKKIKSHKPKHPVSSFFIFYKEKGQAIAKNRGEVLGSKIAKVVGELWKNMSQSEKEPYQVKARIARQKYEQQMIQYKIKYTDELARLKQLKRKARILRKFQQDKKQQEKQLPKVSKDEQLRTKEIINQIQPHQNESSSDDSDLELEDDLSNSLSQILNTSLKEQIIEGVSLPKQINPKIQPQQAVKNTILIESREKQNSSSSDQIRNYQESSSHEYHQTDINLSISNLNAASNQSTQHIQLLDKNQLQTLQQELKDADLIQQQMNQQLIVKNPDQLCQIEDAILKPDNIQTAQQFVKPKGPVSSFFLFYRQKGKWISQTRGIALGPKAIKIASQIWKNLSENEKKVYIQQARQTRKKYYEDKQQLKKKYGQDIFQKSKTTKSNKTKPKK